MSLFSSLIPAYFSNTRSYVESVPAALSPISRYIGSKTQSLPAMIVHPLLGRLNHLTAPIAGYHKTMRPLEPEEATAYIRPISVAVTSWGNDTSWIEPLQLRRIAPNELGLEDALKQISGSIEAKETCIFDSQSLLKAIIVEDLTCDTLFIAFGAMRSSFSELNLTEAGKKEIAKRQQWDIAQELLGYRSELFAEAEKVFLTIAACPRLEDKKLHLVGQCLGGGLAQYVALKQCVSATCLNTLALGAGLQQAIGDKKLMRADSYVTHISAKDDYISDTKHVWIADSTLSCMGVRTPGNFGRRFVIPSAYTNMYETHDYFLGSVMQHIGYTVRTKPGELDEWVVRKAIDSDVSKQT